MTELEKIDMQKSINQIVDILNVLEKKAKDKIPAKIKIFFNLHYDSKIEYKKIELGIPLKEQEMEKYTVSLLEQISNRYLKS